MIRAYLFALDPTPAQEQAFRSHCGAQRYAYNFGLALIRANLAQRSAERSYGIAEDDLIPLLSWGRGRPTACAGRGTPRKVSWRHGGWRTVELPDPTPPSAPKAA